MALTYVADKSALARLKHPTVAARLGLLLVAGDAARCSVIELGSHGIAAGRLNPSTPMIVLFCSGRRSF